MMNIFQLMGTDGSGLISKNEFLAMRDSSPALSSLQQLDIKEKHFDMYVELPFRPDEDGEPASLRKQDLADGTLRLQPLVEPRIGTLCWALLPIFLGESLGVTFASPGALAGHLLVAESQDLLLRLQSLTLRLAGSLDGNLVSRSGFPTDLLFLGVAGRDVVLILADLLLHRVGGVTSEPLGALTWMLLFVVSQVVNLWGPVGPPRGAGRILIGSLGPLPRRSSSGTSGLGLQLVGHRGLRIAVARLFDYLRIWTAVVLPAEPPAAASAAAPIVAPLWLRGQWWLLTPWPLSGAWPGARSGRRRR